ncbi:MAG: hypothetical protein HC771_07425 [Synechococcales cyanobacterium CRU_2_2]|nr:hypothetical protein [Synechococcales cyanobacterium CRU_2_2]
MSSPPSKAFDQPTAHAALNPAPPVTLNPPQRLIFPNMAGLTLGEIWAIWCDRSPPSTAKSSPQI